MSTRIQRLANLVNRELTFWTNTFSVKTTVGDSVDNNRVPTVRQTIRYLNTTNFDLSRDLERVYTVLRQQNLFRKLRRNNNRTDAFDINELLTVVNKYVAKDTTLKVALAKVIRNIA